MNKLSKVITPSKTTFQKCYLTDALQNYSLEIAFQNFYLKSSLKNCFLKKLISKLLSQ